MAELDEFQAKMEEGIVALKNIPPDFCKHMEKAREKERRLRFREENIETLLKEQEDRRTRSLERARVTHTIMWFIGLFGLTEIN